MQSRLIVLVAGLGVAVVGLTYLQLRQTPGISESVSTERVERSEIRTVAALGTLEPEGDVLQLAAPTLGVLGAPRISQLLVKEGDLVLDDQVLAEFDNREEVLADIAEIRAKVQGLDARIKLQKRELDRYLQPASSGAVSLLSVDEAQDELIQLQQERMVFMAQLKGLDADLQKTQLRSPIEGQILRVYAQVGERPSDKGVLEVGKSSKMQARVEVYESDIGRIRLGQTVILKSENGGFNGSLRGKVILISPQVLQREVLSTDPTADADARIVEVLVSLEPEGSAKVSHLSGSKVIARFELK